MPLPSFLTSMGLVILMELGDKTMLTGMCLSAQYRRPWTVLLAVMIALGISTLVAVTMGIILSVALPIDAIVLVSGTLFVGLGIYSLVRSGSEGPESCDNPGTFMSMVSLVLFSELGDKSQIVILALSAQSLFPLMVLFGAMFGFFIVDLLGVYAGNWMSSRISMKAVKRIAGAIFILFGILVIFRVI
jgi:putative Ca2+/H+ antiporter (TMEM165/GDT1 family)